MEKEVTSMRKTYAYVIKRNDEKYYCHQLKTNKNDWNTDIMFAKFYTRTNAKIMIGIHQVKFKNCKVQKICIMECEEDD